VFLSANLISWPSKHQNIVSRSSAKAEYRAVTNGVAEICWLQQLLQELHALLTKSTLIYYDNVRVIYLFTNPI
jgi:glucan phosphorylase